MRTVLPSLLAGLCLARATSAQPAPARGVDYARLADLTVNRTWKLTKGERVVLFWDPALDRGMAAALRTAIAKAGGTVDEIVAPTPASIANLSTADRAKRDRAWQAKFDAAQAAIWLPSSIEAVPDRPFEHLVDKSKVRSIHFHWFLPPDAADVPKVEAMYSAAIAVPPATIAARIEKVERAVRGATVHVTAPNGTDFTVVVPKSAWVHRNTGDASLAKIAGARSVRDREEELPAGVFRTTDLANATGTFIGYNSFDTRAPSLKAALKDGKVVGLESLKGGEQIVARWNAATGDKALPSELVIGTNPELTLLPSGFMPYYGYGAGFIRLALGDNWESGGKNRTPNGEILLFLPGATVTANGVAIVKDGRLIP